MTLTQKEIGLLKDLRTQEEVCIEKYGQYANSAQDGELKNLFSSIRETEQRHHKTICDMLSQGGAGDCCSNSTGGSNSCQNDACSCGTCSGMGDQYLCQDALSMEKHVSSVYDVSIFEFSDTNARDTLNKIQADEQKHGKQIADYMTAHNMYC